MSNDLVKRLREDQPVTQDMSSTMQCALQDAAADRIDELEDKLARAVKALGALMDLNDNGGPFGGEIYRDRVDRAWDNARAALAELKGQDYE